MVVIIDILIALHLDPRLGKNCRIARGLPSMLVPPIANHHCDR